MPDRIKYHNPRPSPIRTFDPAKKERDKFYSSARWRKLRALHLSKHPMCVRCEGRGLTVAANVAHHVIDRLDRPDLAYSPSNLESLCPGCHTTEHKSK